MSEKRNDDAFVQRAKARFDRSVEQLDAGARSRLNRARHAALEAAATGTTRNWRGLLPASGLATAAAVGAIVVLVVNGSDPAMMPVPEPVEADVELLTSDDNLEMIEDLEFYYWMEQLDALAPNDMG